MATANAIRSLNRKKGFPGALQPKNVSSQAVTKAQVRDMIRTLKESNSEMKYFTTTISTTISNAIGLSDLTLIPQGVTVLERVGGVVSPKRLEINFALTTGDATNIIRLLVFWWKPNSTTDVPSLGELFADGTNPTVSPVLPLFVPLEFTIVHDTIVVLDTSEAIRPLRLDLKLNQNTNFNVGVNTGSNHLYLAYVSDSIAVTHPGILAVGVVHYTDS
jgi:hypothetical protein